MQLLLNLVCVQYGTRNQRRHDRDLLGLHNVGIGRIGFRDGGIRVRNVLILVGYRLCRDVYLCYIIYVALGFNCGLPEMEHADLSILFSI